MIVSLCWFHTLFWVVPVLCSPATQLDKYAVSMEVRPFLVCNHITGISQCSLPSKKPDLCWIHYLLTFITYKVSDEWVKIVCLLSTRTNTTFTLRNSNMFESTTFIVYFTLIKSKVFQRDSGDIKLWFQ